MRICFAGTPEVALPALRLLTSGGAKTAAEPQHQVVAVITRPDAASGRGRRVTASPVAAEAERLGLPCLKPPNPNHPDFVTELRSLSPECVAVVAYGALLGPAALSAVPLGWVNLHFSLLPNWRGAAPVEHAIWAGDQITGATTFRIVEELDAGPIFGQMTHQIIGRPTAGQLLEDLSQSGAELLAATLAAIEHGAARPVEQEHHLATRAPKLTVAAAQVDWTQPALAIDRQIRAMTPRPGAWTTWRGERLSLAPTPTDPFAKPLATWLAPGQVAEQGSDVWIGTGSGPMRLGPVKRAGRRAFIPAYDWARGAHLTTSDQMGGGPSA
jgi:methionyl-tRNA formyltransferase